MCAAVRSMTSLRFGTRSKNRLHHGATAIWISKRKIFETRLRLEKISFAHFGPRSIIGSTNGSFDCVYGRPRTIGLRCAARNFQFVGRWALDVRRFLQAQ